MADEPLVFDNGSMLTKAGFAGNNAPHAVFPTIVGTPQFEDRASLNTYVGDDALSKRGALRLKCPIENGIVSDWDDMEKIWYHTFYNEIRVAPEEQPVLLADRPLSPLAQREKTVHIMFETFNVPAMYLANHGVLSVYAAGRKTGVAVECGHGMSYSVPVFEGRALSYATLWSELGGKDMTDYMGKLLYSRGYNYLSSEEELGWMKDMKEKLGYVALDYDRELESAERRISSDVDKNYELPDGQVMTVGAERFKCPEVVFQPYLMDKDADGIHEITNDSIKKCNSDIRKDLYGNIIPSSGSTMFPGFVERLNKEITSLLAPSNLKVKVVRNPDRIYGAWIGGSVIASLNTFPEMWISKGDYDESGPTIVHRKC